VTAGKKNRQRKKEEWASPTLTGKKREKELRGERELDGRAVTTRVRVLAIQEGEKQGTHEKKAKSPTGRGRSNEMSENGRGESSHKKEVLAGT